MSTIDLAHGRQPLGLPKGYVRSILGLLTSGMACGVLLMSSRDRHIEFPLYLLILLGVMYLAYLNEIIKFFRGRPTPNAPHTPSLFRITRDASGRPTETGFAWLMRVLFTLVAIGAPVATVVWQLQNDPENLQRQWHDIVSRSQEEMVFTLAVVLGSLFAGVIIFEFIIAVLAVRFLGESTEDALEDIIAWVSLVGVVGLLILLLIILVINPSLEDPTQQLKPFYFGSVMSGIIAFYYGAGSFS